MNAVPARDRITELANACVKCGLCLPHCPTYALDQVETESPRGRIALSRHMVDDSLAADASALLHLDHCLGCMACERVCPVPVHYGELLDAYRAALPPAQRRPRWLLRLLTRPRWLRLGVNLARGTGARHWLPPLARWLPQTSALRAAIALLPALPSTTTGAFHEVSSRTQPRGRVALFGGCVQGTLERGAQDAAAHLLAAAGFEVIRIDGLCCGALAAHTGDSAGVAGKAQRVAAAIAGAKIDTVLSATPGCIGTLRDDLPGIEVHDALAFLDRHGAALRFTPLPRKATLHLPCTQVNVARADGAVRRLLARVPGLELSVLPTQGHCCGAAGSHMLEFPERAAALRDRVLDAMPQAAPDLLLTANIGCRLHLGAGLHERGARMTIEHPLTLLARQLVT
jgi:glycolate oxidase iron-sulfur subunit